jgi:DNA-binding NarL/FixJ family response regulator
VDDHPLIREGFKKLIANEPDLVICGESGSLREALGLIRSLQPDGVIVELSLADGDGLDLIRRLSARESGLRILVCSMRDDTMFAERALHSGAHGYLSKDESPENVLSALRQVLAGKVYLSPRLMTALVSGLKNPRTYRSGIERLSDRELEIFSLIGKGLATTQIAAQLHLSIKTVETHRENIKRKLHIQSGVELIRRAILWDLQQG